MNNKIKVVQKPEDEIPAEILARAICDIDEAMKKIAASQIKRNTIVVLIKDATGIPKHEIVRVLDALDNLKRNYTK